MTFHLPSCILLSIVLLGGCASTRDTWDRVDDVADSIEEFGDIDDVDDLDDIDGDREDLIEEVADYYGISERRAAAEADAWARRQD